MFAVSLDLVQADLLVKILFSIIKITFKWIGISVYFEIVESRCKWKWIEMKYNNDVRTNWGHKNVLKVREICDNYFDFDFRCLLVFLTSFTIDPLPKKNSLNVSKIQWKTKRRFRDCFQLSMGGLLIIFFVSN